MLNGDGEVHGAALTLDLLSLHFAFTILQLLGIILRPVVRLTFNGSGQQGTQCRQPFQPIPLSIDLRPSGEYQYRVIQAPTTQPDIAEPSMI